MVYLDIYLRLPFPVFIQVGSTSYIWGLYIAVDLTYSNSTFVMGFLWCIVGPAWTWRSRGRPLKPALLPRVDLLSAVLIDSVLITTLKMT